MAIARHPSDDFETRTVLSVASTDEFSAYDRSLAPQMQAMISQAL